MPQLTAPSIPVFKHQLLSLICLAGLPIAACAQEPTASETTSATQTATPTPSAAASTPPDQALVPLEMEILAPPGTSIPRFMVDAAWPEMPSDTIIGQVPGLAVDSDDNVWIAQRPHTLGGTDTGLAMDPPIARNCCRPGPTIMSFAQDGTYLGGWGGPGTGPEVDGVDQWPRNIHGLFVDSDETIWIGGNGDGDHVVLNFTKDGEYIGMVGRHGETDGNASETRLGNPADIWRGSGEVVIADGYINKRIIRFEDGTLDFSGYEGAYAEDPSGGTREGSFDQSQATATTDGGANPLARSFGDIVHCVVGTNDDLIFICDRRNNRAQVFQRTETGDLEHLRDIVIAPETGGTRTVSDIDFSPDGKFIYIADMMNSSIWILDRETYEPLASIGRVGRYPGEFTWLHSVVADSDGNLYTSEVNTGRRVQKLVYMGEEVYQGE